MDFAKRCIVTHVEKEHPHRAEVAKQWHIYSDFKMAKQGKQLDNW